MEGARKFENSEPITPEEEIHIESAELLGPLARKEAKMLIEEVGEDITEVNPEGRGVLTRVQRYARATLLATALSGAFAIGFKPSPAEAGDDRGGRQEYTVTREDIYDKAYQDEQVRLKRVDIQKDTQDIKEVARNRARADVEREKDPRDIIGAAQERELARLDAQRIQRRKNELEQFGRDVARQQAILRNHPIDRFIVNMFNLPNRIVSPEIDRVLDGR